MPTRFAYTTRAEYSGFWLNTKPAETCTTILCWLTSLADTYAPSTLFDFPFSRPAPKKKVSCIYLHVITTTPSLFVCYRKKRKKKEDCVSAYPSVPYLRRPALTMPMGVNYKINIHGQRMHHLGVSICICRSISWCNDNECTQR
jgi:hypothetical protein